MTGPLVELRDLHKSYGEGSEVEVEVLHGLDFELMPGEFTALIGPSGSGKSTLLNILGLLEHPSGGSYRFAGREVGTLAEAELTAMRLRALGFVFQFHHLLPAFSALENVLIPHLLAQGRITAAARERGRWLLDAVGLGGFGERRPHKLSGGQQQRVAIARALSLAPSLVLADEPTGNLDTHTSDELFALLRTFNREHGTAFMIVTHDPRLAARCDRIVELIDGTIAADRANVPS